MDPTVDVPDTPDRLATQGTNRHGESGDATYENHCISKPCHSRQKKILGTRGKDQPIVIDSGRRGLPLLRQKCNRSSGNSSCSVTSATLHCGSSSSSENACLSRKGVMGKEPCPLNDNSINTQSLQSGRSSSISRTSSRDDSFADQTERSLCRHLNGKFLTNEERKTNQPDIRKRSGLPSLAASSHSMTCIPNASCNANGTNSTFKVGTSIDSGEDGTIKKESGGGGFHCARPVLPPRVNRQKRLVRNGCISPNNIDKAQQLAVKDVSGSANVALNSSGSTTASAPISVDIMELVAEDNNSRTRKGKEVVNHPGLSKGHDLRNKNLHSRDSITSTEKALKTDAYIRHAGKSFDESSTSLPSDKKRHLVKETKGPSCSSRHQDNTSQPQARLRPLNGTQSAAKAHIKRQKLRSASSSCGESSTSSEVELPGVSAGVVDPKSSFSSAGNLLQITEVGDVSPLPTCISHDEDARARQVEADERLARELQEQFYSEVPAFGIGEVDENIALALTQQDVSNRGSSRARHPALNARGSSLFNLRRQSLPRSSSNIPRRGSRARTSTLGRPSRLRSRFPGQPRTLLPSGGRTSLFPEDMDIDLRMDILGALEEISDTGIASTILQVQRDFNENDYEMLLALDDNNEQHRSASIHQINGLPESTVQSDNFKEACAICLDIPTIGATIRHLPCLHKFHKDCIDPWLQRKPSCPVCKSSIT